MKNKNLAGTLKNEKGGMENTGWSGPLVPKASKRPSNPNNAQTKIFFFSNLLVLVKRSEINREEIKMSWITPK